MSWSINRVVPMGGGDFVRQRRSPGLGRNLTNSRAARCGLMAMFDAVHPFGSSGGLRPSCMVNGTLTGQVLRKISDALATAGKLPRNLDVSDRALGKPVIVTSGHNDKSADKFMPTTIGLSFRSVNQPRIDYVKAEIDDRQTQRQEPQHKRPM